MTFTLTFDCDNAAFEDDACEETARILREVAKKVALGLTQGTIRDINGNRIGNFTY